MRPRVSQREDLRKLTRSRVLTSGISEHLPGVPLSGISAGRQLGDYAMAVPVPFTTPSPDDVAAAVLTHPAVARLDGGPFGTVASYLPGRRLFGVRIGAPDEAAEISVVVRPGVTLPRLAGEIGALVRGVLGPVAVEVTFSDIVAATPAGH